MSHIANHIHNRDMQNDNTLHVIGVVSNYARFHSRYRLFREWYERMLVTPHVKVYIVEVAFGDRKFECTNNLNPTHLQLRTTSEAWVKESMINCGVKYLLPNDWKYLCWSDTDIEFNNPHWAQETIHQLQGYQLVQPFQQCVDMGPSGNVMTTFQGFAWSLQCGVRLQRHSKEPYQYAHSGYVWACTRRFFEALPGRGLLDCMILGSADYNMAWASIGEVNATLHWKRPDSLIRRLKDWERCAYAQTQGHIGYVPGYIRHYFHGAKIKRGYPTRDSILSRHNFDPDKHLGYDEQGLIRIFHNPDLEHAIRAYNRQRQEDGANE